MGLGEGLFKGDAPGEEILVEVCSSRQLETKRKAVVAETGGEDQGGEAGVGPGEVHHWVVGGVEAGRGGAGGRWRDLQVEAVLVHPCGQLGAQVGAAGEIRGESLRARRLAAADQVGGLGVVEGAESAEEVGVDGRCLGGEDSLVAGLDLGEVG